MYMKTVVVNGLTGFEKSPRGTRINVPSQIYEDPRGNVGIMFGDPDAVWSHRAYFVLDQDEAEELYQLLKQWRDGEAIQLSKVYQEME